MAEKRPLLYKSILEDLIRRIEEGDLKPGDRLPTEKELSLAYGVSRITASRAMNDLKEMGYVVRFPHRGSFVSERPLSRRPEDADWDADESLHSRMAARAGMTPPAPEKAPVIALIIPNIGDNFALNIIRGVTAVFPAEHYRLMIFQSSSAEGEDQLLRYCLTAGVDGILLFPADHPYYSDALLYIKFSNLPLVLLDRTLSGINADSVTSDNVRAGRLCFDHLYTLGHRQIAFLSKAGDTVRTVKDRVKGLGAGAAEMGLPAENLHYHLGFDIREDFETHIRELEQLIYGEKVTALVTAESKTCAYVYRLLEYMDIQVPLQVSLISFDSPSIDIAEYDFVTHIDQDEFDMAKKAARLLQLRLEEPERPIQNIVTDPSLKIRKTTDRIHF